MARSRLPVPDEDENTVPLVAAADDVPRSALVLPLSDEVMFPGAVLRVRVSRPRVLAVVEEALRSRHPVAVLAQRWASIPDPEAADLFGTGTLARVTTATATRDGAMEVELQGLGRVRVSGFLSGHPLQARLADVDAPEVPEAAVAGLARTVRSLGLAVLGAELRPAARELRGPLAKARGAAQVADLVVAGIEATVEEKQAVLESLDAKTRLGLARKLLERRRRVLIGRPRPTFHLFLDGATAVVLTAYLASGAIPPKAPAGWPLDALALLAWIGLSRELGRWLR